MIHIIGAFTHPLHIAIELPHSNFLVKCHSVIRAGTNYVFTHCLQVRHFLRMK